MSPLGLGLWALGVWLGLYVIGFAITTHRFLRFRLGPLRFERSTEAALPEPVRALFQRAVEQELTPLGFEPIAIALSHGPLLSVPPAPMLWLRHTDARVWASISLAHNPIPSSLLRLVVLTYFDDGSRICSVSGEQWALWSDQPEHAVLDRCRVHWADEVRDHLAALAAEPTRTALALDLDEIERRVEGSMLDGLKVLVPLGEAHSEAPTYVLAWRTACKIALRALFPPRELRRLLAERKLLPVWEPEATHALPWVQAHIFRAGQALLEGPVRSGVAWVLFVITAALFALSMSLFGSLGVVAQLTLVLLLHELGHWAAMRVFGYREPAIFFIPFFGAATAGSKHDATLAQRLIVLAAGPVPGLLAGSVALLSGVPLSAQLREFATLAIIVNGANLLPILPLDGGRILQQLVATQRIWLDFGMALASVTAFVALGGLLSQPAFLAIAAVTALSLRTTFEVARLAAQLAPVASASTDLTLSVWSALGPRKLGPATKAAVARKVLERLRDPPSSRRQRALGWVGYGLLLGSMVVGIVAMTRAREAARGVTFACSDFRGPDRRPPAAFPSSASRITCAPARGRDVGPLLSDLTLLADLPSELCVREPWLSAAAAEQARELRARGTVRALIHEAEEHEVYQYSASDTEAQMRAGFEADAKAALAAVEAMVQKRDADPDFDLAAAKAYLAYLRLERDDSDDDSTEEPAELRTLSEMLGRGARCPPPYRVFHASTFETKDVSVMLNGDPRSLASHMCQAGCETLQVKARPRRSNAQ